MLTYSFRILNEQGYKSIATEEFDNIVELYAAILVKGTSLQIKKGLSREYIEDKQTLTALKGRMDISDSLKTLTIHKRKMVCTFDELSVNTDINKIIKTSLSLMLKTDLSKSRKKEIRKIMIYFQDVDLVEIRNIDWNINYNRNNQSLRMLVAVCYLFINGFLQSKSEGQLKVMDFIDEKQMCRLYEKFILEYYRKEHKEIQTNSSKIQWQLDDGVNDLLPDMQTDIMLSNDQRILIIDAKYYTRTVQTYYSKNTLHSGNLYQIFTYVKNKETEIDGNKKVAGMLLYAKTDELILPDNVYKMSGNTIAVKTLDLNCDFHQITAQLDEIVKVYFELQ